jgi:hypothetical protein
MILVLIPFSVFIKGSSNAKNEFPNIILEVIVFVSIFIGYILDKTKTFYVIVTF